MSWRFKETCIDMHTGARARELVPKALLVCAPLLVRPMDGFGRALQEFSLLSLIERDPTPDSLVVSVTPTHADMYIYEHICETSHSGSQDQGLDSFYELRCALSSCQGNPSPWTQVTPMMCLYVSLHLHACSNVWVSRFCGFQGFRVLPICVSLPLNTKQSKTLKP